MVDEYVRGTPAPPHGTGHGSREFGVRDPEGNLWSFGTYRGEARVSGDAAG